MLQQVLHEIEQAQGTWSLTELARKLELEPGVLEGMIAFWVRKGRIAADRVEGQACSSGSCGDCAAGCPFAGAAPRTFRPVLIDPATISKQPEHPAE
ncbi:MAG: hypothetical protein HC837_00115 [Chloroflexaceae bacterium]|nr:hypothetical protein [Chloroflexaceae bacterium]